LINIGLLSAEDKDRNVAILEVKAVDARKTLGGNGITIFKCDHERATEIGDYMHVFYEEIPVRMQAVSDNYRNEDVRVDYLKDYVPVAMPSSSYARLDPTYTNGVDDTLSSILDGECGDQTKSAAAAATAREERKKGNRNKCGVSLEFL
jgi:hypothetical protein